MLMDNILELLGITDSNIKITRFSAESVNGEKRNVIVAREGITATGIARICHCSPLSVIRIIDEAVELKSRVARLPENLCFDEFRSVNSTMSFICCDAEGSHDIVAILENRLTKTIREHFMNRYTNRERAAVKSVVVDLNAQYIKFIKAFFSECQDHHRPLPHRIAGRKNAGQCKDKPDEEDERLPLQGIQDTEGTLASVSQGFR